uniref:F5/8 type C domain-containing protein n=1 Tax=Hanusia phi TaxID=3032 RepID=A0A7S0EBI6_9CRYP|mmetsp:Transcript_18656/g.42696  ORF Transcript_18656/g.42696 Transcript_18656/m.42696 type:complete len:980 (+) Transcript_18656:61-3000(+)
MSGEEDKIRDDDAVKIQAMISDGFLKSGCKLTLTPMYINTEGTVVENKATGIVGELQKDGSVKCRGETYSTIKLFAQMLESKENENVEMDIWSRIKVVDLDQTLDYFKQMSEQCVSFPLIFDLISAEDLEQEMDSDANETKKRSLGEMNGEDGNEQGTESDDVKKNRLIPAYLLWYQRNSEKVRSSDEDLSREACLAKAKVVWEQLTEAEKKPYYDQQDKLSEESFKMEIMDKLKIDSNMAELVEKKLVAFAQQDGLPLLTSSTSLEKLSVLSAPTSAKVSTPVEGVKRSRVSINGRKVTMQINEVETVLALVEDDEKDIEFEFPVLACHTRRCLCHGKGPDPSTRREAQAFIKGSADLVPIRIAAALRGIGFLHRGVKSYHSKWDTYAGDTMLLLAGVALRSQGQTRREAEKRFWQIAAQYEARYQSWASCGAAALDPESNSGDVLGLAEGLLALKWMGLDIDAKEGLKSVWEGVKTALSEQCDTVELLGFDPRQERLPLTKRTNCNNCTSANDDTSTRCRYCGWFLRARPQYEDVTDALVWCYLLQQLGIELDNTNISGSPDIAGPVRMHHVLSIYPQIYPYLPKGQLGTDLFKQQCYLITHLLFTLSRYGQLSLPQNMFRAEYMFLHENVSTAVELNDPELVGEFIDCLAILGASDRDVEMIRGRRFLLELEQTLGGRGRWTDTDAHFYRHYHTSWCAVTGLMQHTFKGEGPEFKQEWNAVAKHSAYWASVYGQVLKELPVESMPFWNLQEDTDADSTNGTPRKRASSWENPGVLCEAERAIEDLTLLGDSLGMESGEIKDEQISASSVWDSQGWPPEQCGARLARLNRVDGMTGCWLAAEPSADQWLEVDLGGKCELTGIATQGRGHTRDGIFEQWVTAYELMTRETEQDEWTSKEGWLGGNTDPHTPVGHKLSPPIVARYVRVCPRAWFEHVSLRVELYGKRLDPLPQLVEPQDEEMENQEEEKAEMQTEEMKA